MEYSEYDWIKSWAMSDSLFDPLSPEEEEPSCLKISGDPKRKFANYQRKIINNLKLRAEYVEFEEVQC